MLPESRSEWEPPLGSRFVFFGLAVLIIAVLIGIRVLLTPVIGDDVNHVTYFGIAGGLIGALGMAVTRANFGMSGARPTVDILRSILGDEEPGKLVREGVMLYFITGALLGGLYPRLGWIAVGSATAGLPSSLLVGLGYGLVLGLLAMLLGFRGLFDLEFEAKGLGIFIGGYLVFGLLLGLVVGTSTILL